MEINIMENFSETHLEAEKYFFYSSGGLDLIEPYLCNLYGKERGSYINNLQRYFDGEEFHNQCTVATSLDMIPEIEKDLLCGQLEREAAIWERAEYIVKFYDEHTSDGTITDNDYYAIAGELGLSGSSLPWYDTMFPHVANLFVTSEAEEERLIHKIRDNAVLVQMVVRLMVDGMRDGQALEFKGRKYWSQGYAKHYFRGENAYYLTSRPSLLRGLDSNAVPDPESDYYDDQVNETIRIGLLRMTEFSLWFRQLSFVKEWPFTIYDGVIAQHYGLKTAYMDVTSDFRTALFFACCTYEDGKWRPLRDDEFAKKDSRKNVADLGGDSRYGVIFNAPADILAMNAAMKEPFQHITKIRPIGYQPFLRSANQRGYMIEANLQYDMYQDWNFGKVRFRLNRQLCDWIFHEMQEGKLVYGNDPVTDISDVVDKIKDTHCFSKRALEEHLAMNSHLSEEEMISYLHNLGYEIYDEVQFCSQERMNEIEGYWQKNLPNWIREMKIIHRPMFIIK